MGNLQKGVGRRACISKLLLLASMIFIGGLSLRAEAQVDNPILSYSCSGEGVSACTNTTTSTIGGVDLIDLNINGTCQGGQAPYTNQYAYTDRCTKIYNLLVIGYTENDEVLNDCDEIDIIGEVDAEASISLVGGEVLATTYSGEDCEGDEFESAPGSILEEDC